MRTVTLRRVVVTGIGAVSNLGPSTAATSIRTALATGRSGSGRLTCVPEDWPRQVMSSSLLGDPDITVYVGYTDGKPVTTGLGLRTGRTIGVSVASKLKTLEQVGYLPRLQVAGCVKGLFACCQT